MTELPAWINNLAADICKLIRQPGAKIRFKQRLKEWIEDRLAEHKAREDFWKRRRQHFQEVYGDERVRDSDAGEPEAGWKWQKCWIRIPPEMGLPCYILVKGWVPLELALRSEPKVTQLFPLTNERELSLTEKYVGLYAVYDYAGKGTGKLKSDWPEVLNENTAGAALKLQDLQDEIAKVPELTPDHERWLRFHFVDVKMDADSRGGTLSKAERAAYQSYEYAVSTNPKLVDATDDEVYDWVRENVPDYYSPPSRETWQRQVRSGRNYCGTQKNTPRAGRGGRSIADVSQIEYDSSQKAE